MTMSETSLRSSKHSIEDKPISKLISFFYLCWHVFFFWQFSLQNSNVKHIAEELLHSWVTCRQAYFLFYSFLLVWTKIVKRLLNLKTCVGVLLWSGISKGVIIESDLWAIFIFMYILKQLFSCFHNYGFSVMISA